MSKQRWCMLVAGLLALSSTAGLAADRGRTPAGKDQAPGQSAKEDKEAQKQREAREREDAKRDAERQREAQKAREEAQRDAAKRDAERARQREADRREAEKRDAERAREQEQAKRDAERGRAPADDRASRDNEEGTWVNGQWYPRRNDNDRPWPNYPYPPGDERGPAYGDANRNRWGGGGNPNQWPDSYGTYRRVPYAEAVIDHVSPRDLSLRLGTTDGMVRDIPMTLENEGVDIVRKRQDKDDGRDWNDGGYDNYPYGQRSTVAYADLRSWDQFLDGRREWFLEINDRSGRGGILRGFRVVTAGGVQQVQRVPARIQGNRTLRALLTPRPQSGYNNYPYPGNNYPYPNDNYPYPNDNYPYPNDNYPRPSGQVGVWRDLPNNIRAGQTVTYDLYVTLPYNRVERVDITDNLPRGWRITRLEPRSSEPENRDNRAVWRLYYPNDQTIRLRVTAIAPYDDQGTQTFSGDYRFDRQGVERIQGENRVNLGGYGGYNPYDPYNNDPSGPWWNNNQLNLGSLFDILLGNLQ